MSLVDSWPSTEMRSNERLTQTPSSRSAVSADSAASVCTKHSSVAKAGEIIPAPLACAHSRTVPDGRSTSRLARFSNASVVWIASAKSASPSGRSSGRARARPLTTARESSGTPITPVEATATWSASARPAASAAGALHLGRVVEPAPAGGGVGVAGVDHHARRASSRQRSRVTSTGAASTPERVKRAALVVSAASETSSPTSGAPLGLIPAATPAARKPAGQPAGGELASRGAPRPSARRRTALLTADPLSFGPAEHQVEVLHRLRRGALPQVVDRREDEHLPVRSSRCAWMRQKFVSRTSRTPGGRSVSSTNGSSA